MLPFNLKELCYFTRIRIHNIFSSLEKTLEKWMPKKIKRCEHKSRDFLDFFFTSSSNFPSSSVYDSKSSCILFSRLLCHPHFSICSLFMHKSQAWLGKLVFAWLIIMSFHCNYVDFYNINTKYIHKCAERYKEESVQAMCVSFFHLFCVCICVVCFFSICCCCFYLFWLSTSTQ